MNLGVRAIRISSIVCLLLWGLPGVGVVMARPNYAVNSGNNCSACHSASVTDRMELVGEGFETDLVTQLDGRNLGPLKTIRAVPGEVVTLSIQVLDGRDRFAVQIKGFETPGQRNSSRHVLSWQEVNGPGNAWTRQERNNPAYFTKDNGANGGLQGSADTVTVTFDLLVGLETPLDIFELVAAVPGVRNGVKVYQEERFYLEVLSPYDLNGDSKIDCGDMCAMVSQWHKDYPAYDFAPLPEGDGVVDANDLVALSNHLFEDYRLLAHWRLDDPEGVITYDSVGQAVGVVVGAPTWRPETGRVDGALLLSGDQNYVRVPFPSNLAIRPFSLFAWAKGGAPGQVLLSQDGMANWLAAAPSDGALLTELQAPGQDREALVSPIPITDGTWHHIGLVWDGVYRRLYVDGAEVARDEITQPAHAFQGLIIGAGSQQSPGSFWSGLVDDIRIYDRAIEPQSCHDTDK